MINLPRTALTAAVLALNDNEGSETVPPATPAATPPAETPPASMGFDDRMKAIFDGMQKDLAAPPAAPPLPTPSSTPAPTPAAAPQITQAPAETGASAPQPAGGAAPAPAAVVPPAGAAPSPPPAAAAPVVNNDVAAALQLLAAQQAQQAQLNAALYARLAPPQQAPAQQTLPDEPPSLEQALADYRMPQRLAGETDAAYDARSQADAYNHAQRKQQSWFTAKAKQIAEDAANGVRNEFAQRQQAEVAARNYVNLVGNVVQDVGYKAQTPVQTAAFNYVDRALTSLHARGLTRDWGEQQWRAAATHFGREFAAAVPPPPAAGGAPALALVPNAPGVAPSTPTTAGPPIANGGQGTSVPGAPPSKATNKPASFDQAMENVWKSMQQTG